jgi:hypothetical protein
MAFGQCFRLWGGAITFLFIVVFSVDLWSHVFACNLFWGFFSSNEGDVSELKKKRNYRFVP